MRTVATIPIAIAALTLAAPAEAYIGPGAGISMLAALWAVLLAVITALGVMVWYPLRALRRARQRPEAASHLGGDRRSRLERSPGR